MFSEQRSFSTKGGDRTQSDKVPNFIDEHLFIEALALAAFEVVYKDPEPTNIEKVSNPSLFFQEYSSEYSKLKCNSYYIDCLATWTNESLRWSEEDIDGIREYSIWQQGRDWKWPDMFTQTSLPIILHSASSITRLIRRDWASSVGVPDSDASIRCGESSPHTANSRVEPT